MNLEYYNDAHRIEHERKRLEHQLHRDMVVTIERRILIIIAVAFLALIVWKYANSFSQEYGYVSGYEIVTESGIHIPNYKLFCSNNPNGRRVTVSYHNGKLEGIYTDNTGILCEPQN